MVSVPCGRMLVMHDAVDGAPRLTATGVVAQPVFALHVTLPLMPGGSVCLDGADIPFGRLSSGYSPLMLAVNVTCWPARDGFKLEVIDTPGVACVMLKLLVWVLLEPL